MSLGKAFASIVLVPAALASAWADDAADCRNENLKATRIEACNRLIASHPSRDEALAQLYDLRAAAHGDKSDYAASAEDLGMALRLRPPNAGGLVKRGAQLFRSGDTDAAVKDFNDAVVLDPKDADARIWRGRAYRKLEQLTNAEADLDTAIALDPKDANAWLVRGLIRDDQKRFNDSISDYTRAAALSPDSVWPVYNRAWAKIQLKQFKDALVDVEACRKIDPELADCFDLKGETLAEMSDFKGAAEAYSQAIARDPETARLYKARSAALRKAGDVDAAIQDLTEAYKIDSNMETLYDRGWLYSISGRPDNAISDYSMILRREGADSWPSALIERGLARIVRGDLAAAQEDFASARQVAPGNVRAALWRAALEIRLNRESFWAPWRRNDTENKLSVQRSQFKPERYEAPFVQAVLGERGVAEAHRVAHMAAKTAEDPQDAACFADAMAGALALANGDETAAQGYFAKASARNYPASYSCMIATAELNRLRNR